MSNTTNQNLILIEGAATYERILAEVRELETYEGIRHILDFVRIYPDFAPAHNDLAVLFYQEGNKLKSLAHYEKAHKLDPGNVTYRKNLADFYFIELEWTGDAVNTYLGILKDNPFDIEALNALGTISLQLGRKEQAQKYFSRTLQLDTDNHEARQAIQQLAPASATLPELQQVLHATPSIQHQIQPIAAIPQAEPAFQNLFRVEPTAPVLSAEILYKNAMQQAHADNISETTRQLENLLLQYPEFALAHNDLGVLYQKAGAHDKSRQHHEAAVRLQPDNEIFQKNLADLLCTEFGALEDALAIYVKLLARNQYDIEVLKAIAYICIEVGKRDDAGHFLKQILAIKPWDQEVRATLSALDEAVTGSNTR